MVLDVESGEELPWSKFLCALTLPTGKPLRGSTSWLRPSPSDDDGGGDDDDPPLILQVAVQDQLHFVDIAAFIQAFDEDGNFAQDQLARLSDHNADRIEGLLQRWPHLINVRNAETGDTVLHHCATSAKGGAVLRDKWLGGSAPFSLTENAAGRSALREAVRNHQSETAVSLLKRLDPKLLLARTEVLTEDLVAIGEEWPQDVVTYIELLEDPGFFSLFRKQRELSVLRKRLVDFVVRASPDGDEAPPWKEYERDDESAPSVKCDCEVEVLALRGFASAPTEEEPTPFTRLYRACEHVSDEQLNALLGTKLMVIVTSFKWNTYVKRRIVKRLCGYLLHFALAALCLLRSTQFSFQNTELRTTGLLAGWDESAVSTSCDVLHVAMVLTNTVALCQAVNQLRYQNSLLAFLSDSWNLCDIAGIVALYAASLAYFTRHPGTLQLVGAVGVLLNSFSFLKLLRPFEFSGPLIKTVLEIMRDIRGFMAILAVLLWGFSVAFAVSMPDNLAFVDGGAGPLVGLLTSFGLILGSLREQPLFTNSESTVLFLMFLLLLVIVLLNLLIAIMSDSFEKVMENWVVEARKMTAATIIAEEALISQADRADAANFPEFLQILQATREKDPVWSGLSGKLAQVEERVCDAETRLTQHVAAVQERLDEAERERRRDMAELKALVLEMREMKSTKE